MLDYINHNTLPPVLMMIELLEVGSKQLYYPIGVKYIFHRGISFNVKLYK